MRLSIFSVDRIINLKELSETFVRPADFKLSEYLNENCFNGIHGESVTVRLKAVGITARIFNERQFHPSQKIVESKQRRGDSLETVTIEMRVASGRGLMRFILSHLPNIEVVSPKEVREEVKKVIEDGLNALEQSDREDEITGWLEKHQIEGGWKLASTLVEAGIDAENLDAMAAAIDRQSLRRRGIANGRAVVSRQARRRCQKQHGAHLGTGRRDQGIHLYGQSCSPNG